MRAMSEEERCYRLPFPGLAGRKWGDGTAGLHGMLQRRLSAAGHARPHC